MILWWEASVAIFDQRGQQVTNQYNFNENGNINIGEVQNKTEFISELRKLQTELAKAVENNALESDKAIDAEYQLKKAVSQAEKPESEKKTLIKHLSNAKDLVSGVSGLAGAISQAIEKIPALFQ